MRCTFKTISRHLIKQRRKPNSKWTMYTVPDEHMLMFNKRDRVEYCVISDDHPTEVAVFYTGGVYTAMIRRAHDWDLYKMERVL